MSEEEEGDKVEGEACGEMSVSSLSTEHLRDNQSRGTWESGWVSAANPAGLSCGLAVYRIIARTNLVLDKPPHELPPRAVASPLDSANNDRLVRSLHIEGPIHRFLHGRDIPFHSPTRGDRGGSGRGRTGDGCWPLIRSVHAIARSRGAKFARVSHGRLGGVQRVELTRSSGRRRRWWVELATFEGCRGSSTVFVLSDLRPPKLFVERKQAPHGATCLRGEILGQRQNRRQPRVLLRVSCCVARGKKNDTQTIDRRERQWSCPGGRLVSQWMAR